MLNPTKSIMIIFGRQLSEEQFLKEEVRKNEIREGIELIKTNFPNVAIQNFNSFSCTVSVRGSEASLQELKLFLTSRKIPYEDTNKPVLRPA